MARLLALEYDQFEARVVMAQSSGGSATFERAFSIDLSPREGAESTPIGERLLAALTAHGVSRGDALVAVGRASIELRVLSVPPAPDDELPELVRFQATQQFTSLGDDWPLDFVKLRSSGEEGQSILAAAISPELLLQIKDSCKTANVTPRCMVLRPFAAASLLKRKYSDNRCRLMVDLLAGEADLTVLEEGEVVFLRTVRLPQNEAAFNGAVLGEVRRTMLAAQNQLGGRAVEQVVLCGDEQDYAAIQAHLNDALSVDVELFDPFKSVQLGGELAGKLPEHHGRFAPLLGLLLDESEQQKHDIDFLNPRKKVEEQKPWRTYALAAGAAAAVVLAIAFMGYSTYASRATEISDLEEVKKNRTQLSESLAERNNRVAAFEDWEKSNVVWLDELHDVSDKFPPSEDAMSTLLTTTAAKEGGGVMFVEGVSRDYNVIDQIEVALTDDNHIITGAGGSPNDRVDGYSVGFKEKITIAPSQNPSP